MQTQRDKGEQVLLRTKKYCRELRRSGAEVLSVGARVLSCGYGEARRETLEQKQENEG